MEHTCKYLLFHINLLNLKYSSVDAYIQSILTEDHFSLLFFGGPGIFGH